jgi:hypothetical protein
MTHDETIEAVAVFHREKTEELIAQIERHINQMERDTAIIEEYLSGASGLALKKEHRTDAYYLLRKYRIPRRKRGARKGVRNPERHSEISQLLEKNITFQEIGERYGVSRQRIQQISARLGIYRRAKSNQEVTRTPPIFSGNEVPAMYQIKAGLDNQYKEYAEKNSDPYGSGVVRYSAKWAGLMEEKMKADGIDTSDDVAVLKFMVDNANSLSHVADTEGITGFMYGCAVSALAHFWQHGEQLRRWHNKETQIGTEGDRANETGGVLNPAVMTIG